MKMMEAAKKVCGTTRGRVAGTRNMVEGRRIPIQKDIQGQGQSKEAKEL